MALSEKSAEAGKGGSLIFEGGVCAMMSPRAFLSDSVVSGEMVPYQVCV